MPDPSLSRLIPEMQPTQLYELLDLGLTGILYQFVREYSEGFERDGGVGQGPAFEALAPHQH
jgi:hypothetical protein